MLQACLNGGRGDPAPATPEACAIAARAAIGAGAEELHIHPRDADGAETLAPEHVGAWLSAVRHAVPSVPVGIGTGAWIPPGGRARHALMAEWEVLPDYVSINVHEDDAPEVMQLMRDKGIGIEAGVWTPAAAEQFVSLSDRSVLRVLVELHDGSDAEAEAAAILEILGRGTPILLHGDGDCAWSMIRRAVALGLDTRIGLEDTLTLPDGTPAADNAALVRAARAILEAKA